MNAERYNPNNPDHQDPLVGVSQWQEDNNYSDSEVAIKLATYEMEIEERDGYVEVEPMIRSKWEEKSHQRFVEYLTEMGRKNFLDKESGAI